MAIYGLIGYPLSHSFSKKYFENKFQSESLRDNQYKLFEIEKVDSLKDIIKQNPNLKGLNITIPHKESVIPYLDKLNDTAKKVGAVNVIRVEDKYLTGYNSDYFGFEKSLFQWFPEVKISKAVILGTGGAAKAVMAVLKDNNIEFTLVSRTESTHAISYQRLNTSNIIAESNLIINTTPLGMAPKPEGHPAIDYNQLSDTHYVYDLIYNPAETTFLKKAYQHGAKIKNGYEMLELQAEKSWEIWTS
ncbi:MAG: shikimate dehydrogenase [Bacteroidota bacterium]